MKKNIAGLALPRACAIATAIALGATGVTAVNAYAAESAPANPGTNATAGEHDHSHEHIHTLDGLHVVTEGHQDLLAYTDEEGFKAALGDDSAGGGHHHHGHDHDDHGHDDDHGDHGHDHDHSGRVLRGSGTFAFQVSDKTIQEVDAATATQLGLTAGDKVYVLPETREEGIPYLGISTDVKAGHGIDTDEPVTVSLADVEGPGRLIVTQSHVDHVDVRLDSDDKDRTWERAAHSHSHLSFIFTEAGVYEVTLRFSAVDDEGETEVEDLKARFIVGDEAFIAQTKAVEDPADDDKADDQDDDRDTNDDQDDTNGQSSLSSSSDDQQSSLSSAVEGLPTWARVLTLLLAILGLGAGALGVLNAL